MLTLEKAIALIKKHQPHYSWDMNGELPLKFLGAGVYREVFAIKGLGVAVKFPLEGMGGVDHSRKEIRAFEKLFKRAPAALRKHLPEIYYTNKRTGVIVMKEYKPCHSAGDKLSKMLREFFKQPSGGDYDDYGYCNFGLDGRRLIALDLGIT